MFMTCLYMNRITGLVGSLIVNKWYGKLLFQVEPTDDTPYTIFKITVLGLGIGALVY